MKQSGVLKGPALQSEPWHQKSTEPTVRSSDQVLHGWIDSARWGDAQSSQTYRGFDSSTWSFAYGLILSTVPSGIKSVLQWSVGIVKRCEIDPVPCRNGLHLLDPLRSDEPSSLRERLEPVVQSKSHAFE